MGQVRGGTTPLPVWGGVVLAHLGEAWHETLLSGGGRADSPG